MQTARRVELCFLYLGVVLFVQFERRRGSDETVWPPKFVVGLFVLAAAYTVWVGAQLFVLYAPN